MIHQILLRKAVERRDPILREFVETVAPRILERFVTVAALGGSAERVFPDDPCLPQGLERYSPDEFERFSSGFDQSMTTHILNGIFAGYRIAELLPSEKAPTDIEKRLWLLGYVAHDYVKVFGIKLQAGELDKIRQVVRCLAEALDYRKFLPDWEVHLDDIVFIAQNTQTVVEANLNLRDYRLKTNPRQLDVLRLLSTYSDVLVHVKSPSEVLTRSIDDRDTAYKLRKTLEDLFGQAHAPRLAYHKLTEVRGLLSNLINNALIEVFKETGYEPYLFFPNGVVYLASQGAEERITRQPILGKVWDRLVELIGRSEDLRLKRANVGLKMPPALYDLLDIRGLLALVKKETMRLTQSKAQDRLNALFGESKVKSEGLVADLRVDKVAEYLIFLKQKIFAELFPTCSGVSEFLLDALGLKGEVQVAEAEQMSGTLPYGWFYPASKFITKAKGLDENQLEQELERVSTRVLDFIDGEKLRPSRAPVIAEAFKDYVADIVEIDGHGFTSEGQRRSFEEELRHYVEAKSRNQLACSLCSSPNKADEQMETAVLFMPQQPSNKARLGGPVKRGICPICALEMLLRQVQQGAPAKQFEERKPVHLYLYPTYFFTPETAIVVRLFIDRLQDVNIWAVRQHLRKESFSQTSVLNYRGFLVEEGEEPRTLTMLKPKYSERDLAGVFFFSTLTLGKNPTDTDSWAIPVFLALSAPIILNVKVVATPSFVPIYGSGADFRETVVLDAPHQFARHVLRKDRFRVDEVDRYLIKLLELYDLHLDVFGKEGDPNWGQINAVAKDVVTDPYYVFSYYERKERSKRAGKKKANGERKESKGISPLDLKRYLEIYQALGGDAKMGIVGEIVNAYANFYRAEDLKSVYGIVKPLSLAIDVTVKSDPKTCATDLELLIAGPISDLMDRIRDKQADGFDPIWTDKSVGEPAERAEKSRQAILDFARLFLNQVFNNYCSGSRATLRERANLLRSAAHFYYLDKYGHRSKESKDTKKEANHE